MRRLRVTGVRIVGAGIMLLGVVDRYAIITSKISSIDASPRTTHERDEC